MINEATRRFVHEHADDDVRQLALRASKDAEVDLTVALQQIQGRQMAVDKLPTWAAVDGIIYPPHLSMEQCSSETTARYKASVATMLSEQRQKLVDLTGGFGVDFYWMAQAFQTAVYVEQQPMLMDIAAANFTTLGLKAETVRDDAANFLHRMEHASLIFLDPARRDNHGVRTYGIADCSPNVLTMVDELMEKADFVMLKLSPMLDWRKAVADIGPQRVSQVHIVAVKNECKELLLVLSCKPLVQRQVICVNGESIDTFPLDDDSPQAATWQGPLAGAWLYEPHAALMKAGFFSRLAERHHVSPLARNSHLFVADHYVEHFPGRSFRIVDCSSMNKRELSQKIIPLRQANISVRNFPMTVAALRQRLKLSEGGSNYVFATTLASGEKVLLVTTR